MERLIVSDSAMGDDSVLKVVKGISESKIASKTLKEFFCNYNEVESNEVAKEILDLLMALPALENVEFKGNTFSNKLKGKFEKAF